jgi:ABC-2 type transport system permease protein
MQSRSLLQWVRLLLNVYGAEFKRFFLLEWRYPLEAFGKVIMLYLIFRVVTWGGDLFNPTMDVEAFRTGQTERLIGYTYFFLTIAALQNGANLVRQEAELGVFEQVYLSPLDFAWLVFIRGVSTIIANLVPMLVLFMISVWTLSLTIVHLSPTVLLILLMGGIAMQGLGLILTGVALIFKRIQALMNLLTILLLIVSVIPMAQIEGIWQTLAVWFPFTHAIHLLSLSLQNIAISQEQLLILSLSSVVIFIMGFIAMKSAEHLALDRGMLGQY